MWCLVFHHTPLLPYKHDFPITISNIIHTPLLITTKTLKLSTQLTMESTSNYREDLLDLEDIDNECVICWDTFSENHPAIALDNCRHVVGKKCLEAWLRSNNDQRDKCPTCRVPLFGDEVSQAEPQGQPDQPTNAFPATGAHGPTLQEIDIQTHEMHDDFLNALYHASFFNRHLWKRVSRELVPMYIAADNLITPEIDAQARTILIELLQGVVYYADAVDRPDYKHLLKRSLEGNQMAILLTRRLMQCVMTMVMLVPLMPMEKEVVQGCYDQIPNLYHVLGFDMINSAVADPTPENASILRVLTMALVDSSVDAVITDALGEQWLVSAESSDEFFIAAQRVKDRMRWMDASERDDFRKMKVSNVTVAALWQGGDDEEAIERQRPDKPVVALIKGICDGIRNVFRRDDGLREAPRVLTKKSRSRSSFMGFGSSRVNGGYQRLESGGSVDDRQRSGRSRSFTFLCYSNERF